MPLGIAAHRCPVDILVSGAARGVVPLEIESSNLPEFSRFSCQRRPHLVLRAASPMLSSIAVGMNLANRSWDEWAIGTANPRQELLP